MNRQDSSDRLLMPTVVIVLAASLSATADIPGRGGRLLTAYQAPARLSVAEVEQAKTQARECRYLQEARIRGSREPLRAAGVGFLATKSPSGRIVEEMPVFQLTVHQKNNKKTIVDLSCVESIKILETKGPFLWIFGQEKALVEVVLFPTITPEALLARPVSYSELRRDYITTVMGWVYLKQDGGKPLCLTAKTDGACRVLARFGDLEPSRALLFDNRYDENCLWWAVDSVINDNAYPYLLLASRR